jgi:hypothetical protein
MPELGTQFMYMQYVYWIHNPNQRRVVLSENLSVQHSPWRKETKAYDDREEVPILQSKYEYGSAMAGLPVSSTADYRVIGLSWAVPGI